MKVSNIHLCKWVNGLSKYTVDKVSEKLTLQGLEVDEVIALGEGLKNIEVGHVLEITPHPDADKLRVCTVLVADDQKLNIVCGAKNVDAGQNVPVARIGAVLPGNFKIKKSKLRGVLSEGMICSEAELGLADSAPGIMVLPKDAKVGVNIIDYLNLDDHIIDIDLTANRGDCASYIGVAREIAVANSLSHNLPDNLASDIKSGLTKRESKKVDSLKCHHGEKDLASAYKLLKIDFNSDITSTPIDLSEFLRRSDISSVNLIVDILNAVMLNLGQPMHAFDANEVEGIISVRFATKGEKIKALNDQEYNLNTETLIIADDKGPLAIAGVIGGHRGSVSAKTKSILLEAAAFNHIQIAKQAKAYGLQTDSSYRFERGVDFGQLDNSLNAVIGALAKFCPDLEIKAEYSFADNNLSTVKTVDFDLTFTSDYLGVDLDNKILDKGFKTLGFDIVNKSDESWKLSIPSWRHDVSVQVDLIEEAARIIGYDNIDASLPKIDFSEDIGKLTSKQLANANKYYDHSFLETSYGCLLGRNYSEAINYGFISKDLLDLFGFSKSDRLELANPISQELAIMRPSLLPGLLKACEYNAKRQQNSVRLFEQGRVFNKDTQNTDNKTPAIEHEVLSGLIYADASPLSSHGIRTCDFYDIKADVMAILAAYTDDINVDTKNLPGYFHPGQGMRVLYKGEVLGYCGALHPELTQKLDLTHSVYVFELKFMSLPNLNSRSEIDQASGVKLVSKYPQVTRDLAFLLDSNVLFGDIRSELLKADNKILQKVECFDEFSDEEKLGEGKKSLAIRLTLQDAGQTLSEESINSVVAKALEKLKQKFDVILRD
jgi:phenylalanyl-tRNA synthetase beta chain